MLPASFSSNQVEIYPLLPGLHGDLRPAKSHRLEQPGHVLAQGPEVNLSLGISLHIAGLEAVDQRPVGGGGKKHLGAVEVPLEAVQRGAPAGPPGHGHRRAHLVPEGAAAVVVSSE